jgi:hypothetical protein
MEHIRDTQLAQLMKGSAEITERSRSRLPDEAFAYLSILMDQMQAAYPHQDLSDSMQVYMEGYEQLALRYSMAEVQDALAEWLITPGAKFFPRPDEGASLIERRREAQRVVKEMRAQAEKHKADIAEFWAVWVPQWKADLGIDEEEILRRHPSYRGTKPKC